MSHYVDWLMRLIEYSVNESEFITSFVFLCCSPFSCDDLSDVCCRTSIWAHKILVLISLSSSEGSDRPVYACSLARVFVTLIHKV